MMLLWRNRLRGALAILVSRWLFWCGFNDASTFTLILLNRTNGHGCSWSLRLLEFIAHIRGSIETDYSCVVGGHIQWWAHITALVHWTGVETWLTHSWCSVYHHQQLSLLAISTSWSRADSRFAPSQWETALLYNDVSHWLGANLESAIVASPYIHPWQPFFLTQIISCQ